MQLKGIYAEDDSEEDKEVNKSCYENEEEVIKPSKSKFDKFVEEVKIRETTAMQKIFKEIKVAHALFCDCLRTQLGV